ncbi:MAG: hypothetical protein ACKO37_04475 [Vampirovibrionales bacterium]
MAPIDVHELDDYCGKRYALMLEEHEGRRTAYDREVKNPELLLTSLNDVRYQVYMPQKTGGFAPSARRNPALQLSMQTIDARYHQTVREEGMEILRC